MILMPAPVFLTAGPGAYFLPGRNKKGIFTGRPVAILKIQHIPYFHSFGIGFKDGQGVDVVLKGSDNFQAGPAPYLYKMVLKGIQGNGPVQVVALGQRGAGSG
jgi:hypothetical protein